MIVTEEPEIVVENDYDGYFERIVRSWVATKAESGAEFKHTKIHISSGPYRPQAVSIHGKDNELFIDFYSALRVGFGSLSPTDVNDIISFL